MQARPTCRSRQPLPTASAAPSRSSGRHTSRKPASTKFAKRSTGGPDVVAVELDDGRYRQMKGGTPDDIEAEDLLSGNTVFQFLAYWMLSYVQSRLGDQFDIEPEPTCEPPSSPPKRTGAASPWSTATGDDPALLEPPHVHREAEDGRRTRARGDRSANDRPHLRCRHRDGHRAHLRRVSRPRTRRR